MERVTILAFLLTMVTAGSTEADKRCDWGDHLAPFNSSQQQSFDAVCSYVSIASEMWCVRRQNCKENSSPDEAHALLEAALKSGPRISAAAVLSRRLNGSFALQLSSGSVDEAPPSWSEEFGKAVADSAARQTDSACHLSRPFKHCVPPLLEWSIVVAAPFECSTLGSSASERRGYLGLIMPLRGMQGDPCGVRNPCDPISTECVSTVGRPFGAGERSNGYSCRCRPGFYRPEPERGNPRPENTSMITTTADVASNRSCVKCPGNRCPSSEKCDANDGGTCETHFNFTLRATFLGIQILSIALCLALMVFILYARREKVIASAMWTMLLTIILGSCLIYGTIIVDYFEASTVVCLLGPWIRELGFAITYGSVILKIYKIQVEFRRRKAHRWIIKNRDMLTYLSVIVLLVSAHMVGWTTSAIDRILKGESLMASGKTLDGDPFTYCRRTPTDYFRQAGELCALFYAIFISYQIRRAETEYNERMLLSLCIYFETVSSFIVYAVSPFFVSLLHPDVMLAILFIRCHFSTTLMILLLFGSKIWHAIKEPSGHNVAGNENEFAPEDVEGRVLDISEMDPEVVKDELKRLYTQLQILHNKTMRRNNPHISKRRGGRKATHRRFSLQGFHHRQQAPSTNAPQQEATAAASAGPAAPAGKGPSATGIEPDSVTEVPEGRSGRNPSMQGRPSTSAATQDQEAGIIQPDGSSTANADVGSSVRGIGRKRCRQYAPTEC